jgi:hypothetical protein
MFHQYVNNAALAANVLSEHPALIIERAEFCWEDVRAIVGNAVVRNPATAMPNVPLPVLGRGQVRRPGPQPDSWDHLIYAFLIENTGIFDILRKAAELYKSSAQLPPARPLAKQFWFMVENVVFSPPATICVLRTAIKSSDETEQRHALYRDTFGLELDRTEPGPHGRAQGPRETSSEFVRALETFLHEAWRGIVQQRSATGVRDINYRKLAISASALHDYMIARRERTDLTLEEFRAVAIMSLLHTALSFNSAVVTALGADAFNCAERLAFIGKLCGIAAHPRANSLFEISRPLSGLLRFVEAGAFSTVPGAQNLCRIQGFQDLVETVVGLYPEAMGRGLARRDAEIVALPVNPKLQRRLFALQAP